MVVLYGLTPSDAEYIKWRSDVSGYGRRLVQVEEALAKLNSKDRKAIDEVLEKILGTEFRRQAYLTASLNEDGTGICSNDLLQGKRQLVFSLGTNQCNPADASINSDARKHVQCLEKRINQPLNPEEDSVRARFERLNNFHQAQGILRTVETIKSECAAAKNELTEFDRYLTEVIRRNLTNRYQASGWEGSLELFGGLTQANNNDVDGFGGAKVCYGRADFIIRLCADAGILTHRYKSEPRTETKVQTTSQNLGSGYSEDSVLTTITEEGYKPLWFAGGRVEISPNNYLHFTLGADAYVVEDVTEETTKREAQMKFNGVNDEALYTVNKADTTRKTNVHGVPKAGAEACLGIFCLGGEAGYDLDAEKPVYEGKVGVRLGF
jgi:hypothetical protein